MSPLDLNVWRRFLLLHPDKFTSLRYDVKVGTGARPWPASEGPKPEDWEALTQKRIDAVGIWNGSTAIIEVKPRASFTALGQLLAYRTLLAEKERPTAPVTLWVVCEERDADLETTFLSYGVSVVSVGM